MKKDKLAIRRNEGKVQWSLVPMWTLHTMIRALEFGAYNYAPDNWKKGQNREEILESIQRHLTALFDGEELDPDIKKHPTHHIGHIMCNCVFYIWHMTKGTFSERRTPLGAHFKIEKKKKRKPRG